MEAIHVGLTIYSSVVIGILIVFLWRVAYFYERTSGHRVGHYFFVVPALLGGTSDILIAQLIQFNLSTVLNWGFAAALGTVLLVITLVTYVVADRWLKLNVLWGESR